MTGFVKLTLGCKASQMCLIYNVCMHVTDNLDSAGLVLVADIMLPVVKL